MQRKHYLLLKLSSVLWFISMKVYRANRLRLPPWNQSPSAKPRHPIFSPAWSNCNRYHFAKKAFYWLDLGYATDICYKRCILPMAVIIEKAHKKRLPELRGLVEMINLNSPISRVFQGIFFPETCLPEIYIKYLDREYNFGCTT